MDTTSGALDEAWERLHHTGPEFRGFLSNHGPMAVEALVRHGQSGAVHRWVDRYTDRLEEVPSARAPVTETNWPQALGDWRRVTDWTDHLTRQVAERPWRAVLAEWWPRLLPGISGAATHPVIRVGHAVRVLREEGEQPPRLAELGHALGYWAARQTPLPVAVRPGGELPPAEALAALPRIADQQVSFLGGLAQLPGTEGWREAAEAVRMPAEPEVVREQVRALVRAATHRYRDYGHGNAVMLVHSATAPNAVLRVLPSLPHELWAPSLAAAWAASAAITAVYAPARPLAPLAAGDLTPEEVFARAAEHGDEHAIKFADTALDVAAWSTDGDDHALSAALRAVELIPPEH